MATKLIIDVSFKKNGKEVEFLGVEFNQDELDELIKSKGGVNNPQALEIGNKALNKWTKRFFEQLQAKFGSALKKGN